MERLEISKKTSLVSPIMLGRCKNVAARFGLGGKDLGTYLVSLPEKALFFFWTLGVVPKPKKDGKGGCSLNDTDQDRVKRI